MKAIPEEERGRLATEALRETKALSVAGIIIHLNDHINHKDVADFTPALDLETLAAMKAIRLHLIRSRAASFQGLLADPDLVSRLYLWRHFTGSLVEPRKWVMDSIKANEDFVSMVRSMMSSGRRHTSGDRVSKVCTTCSARRL